MPDTTKMIAELEEMRETARPLPYPLIEDEFGVYATHNLAMAAANALPGLIAGYKRLQDAVNIETAGHDNTSDELAWMEGERDAANTRAEKAEAALELVATHQGEHQDTELDLYTRLELAEEHAKQMQAERDVLVRRWASRDWGKCDRCPAFNGAQCDGHLLNREHCHEKIRQWAAHEAAKCGAATVPPEVDRDCSTCKHEAEWPEDGASDCESCRTCCEDTFSSWEYSERKAGEEEV